MLHLQRLQKFTQQCLFKLEQIDPLENSKMSHQVAVNQTLVFLVRPSDISKISNNTLVDKTLKEFVKNSKALLYFKNSRNS